MRIMGAAPPPPNPAKVITRLKSATVVVCFLGQCFTFGFCTKRKERAFLSDSLSAMQPSSPHLEREKTSRRAPLRSSWPARILCLRPDIVGGQIRPNRLTHMLYNSDHPSPFYAAHISARLEWYGLARQLGGRALQLGRWASDPHKPASGPNLPPKCNGNTLKQPLKQVEM